MTDPKARAREVLAVTQADREAAAKFLISRSTEYQVRNGLADDQPLVQAFARHAAEREQAVRAEIINTPETADFMAAVPLEAAHQRERWGAAHDAGKTALDWFWLLGYLGQKAARAAEAGDLEKAKHHTISTAAALANWHAALTGADTAMRPGIDPAAHGLTPIPDRAIEKEGE